MLLLGRQSVLENRVIFGTIRVDCVSLGRVHEVLLGWVWWTVEKRLAINGASLLELLFHLIWCDLLADSHLSKLYWTLVIVRVCVTTTCRLIRVALLNLIDETVLVLTLQGASNVLLLSSVLFCARLGQLLHLPFHLCIFAVFLLNLRSSITPLYRSFKEVLIQSVG